MSRNSSKNPIVRLLASASDNPILEKFLSDREADFKSYEQRELAKYAAVEHRKALISQIADKKKFLAAVKHRVAETSALDEVSVVLAGIRHESDISPYFTNMRDRVATIQFAKTFGPKIVARIEKDLADLEDQFSSHDRQNADLLREAGVEI